MKKNARTIWDIYSYCYDSLLALIPYRRLIEKVLFFGDVQGEDRVLDIGCGTGNIEMMNDIKSADFYCVDFSKEMISRAKKKSPNYKYFFYDINNDHLPFKEGFFDKILSCNVVYNANDLDGFFCDVYRVMKDGGAFVFTTSIKEGSWPIIKEHLSESGLGGFLGIVLKLPQMLFVSVINMIIDSSDSFTFYKTEVLIQALEAAGFKVVIEEKTYGGINTIIHAVKPIDI